MSPAGNFDIEQLLDEVITLPSMPDTLAQLTTMLNDPDCAMGDVAKLISMDPAIALKTLRLVNSAYYGLGQEVKSVDHAVVMLGAKVIKNLVLTASVFETFEGGVGRFLEHSIACGVAMRSLAKIGPLKAALGSPDEAFVYGLLHDIGKVIFRQYMPDACDRVARTVAEKQCTWHSAELEVIGVDHGVLGARLAQKWKLSRSIVAAIAFHHDIAACPKEYQPIAANLAVANHLVSAAGYPSTDDAVIALPAGAWEASGLARNDLPVALDAFCEALNEITELLSMAA